MDIETIYHQKKVSFIQSLLVYSKAIGEDMMIVQAEKIYNKIPLHMKQALNLPLNYLDLSVDQMLFINEFYFASSQKVDLKKMKKALADAAINADLIYIAMNDLDDLLKDAE